MLLTTAIKPHAPQGRDEGAEGTTAHLQGAPAASSAPVRGGPPGSTRVPGGYREVVAETSLWRAAVRPRMLGLLVLLLAAAAVCGRLGAWQLERAEVRGAAAAQREAARVVTADPEPLADLLAPGQTFVGDLVARKALVSGTYDDDGTLLVTGREHAGRTDGYLVLTPLHVATPDGTAVLPVVRGWSPTPDVAPAPAGEVEVVGWLQAGEEAGTTPVDGRTDAISAPQLLTVWGGPVYTGYLVVQTGDPADPAGLEPLDPPTRAGSGLNVQNLAYAAQWWIFGLFAVGLWWRLVRDEAAGRPPLPGDGDASGAPPTDVDHGVPAHDGGVADGATPPDDRRVASGA